MTTACHPLPPSIAQEMLQTAARAICDRPGESPEQRDSRTHQMVHAALAMQPRDGLEYMLSILTVGHFSLVEDSMRDILQGQPDAAKARAKSTIVALDRSLMGFVRELHLSQERPLADTPVEARAKEDAPAPETSPPPAPTTPPQSHRALPQSHRRVLDKTLPFLMASQDGKGFPAAPVNVPPIPVPPAAPSRPPNNVLLHPQPGKADRDFAEFEEALVAAAGKLATAHAPEVEDAKPGD